MTTRLLEWLEGTSKISCLAGALIVTVGIGYLDYVTGPELGFSFFYLLPVALAAWTVGGAAGITIAGCCATAWLIADLATGSLYSTDFLRFWNGGVRMGIFTVVAVLLSALREALIQERALSRHDAVTTAVNSRYFRELLAAEIARTERSGRPFTLVYFDLDNFKAVNDTMGHHEGDRLLKQCVVTLIGQLRRTDVVSRLGGDEFACLMPDTGEAGAATALSRLARSLNETMRAANWPVTFSVGAVTFVSAPEDSDHAIRLADELMYEVKRGGKDGLRHETFAQAMAETR